MKYERTLYPGRHLTDRQREVMELVANGLSTKEIAKQLGINPRTVQKHISTVLQNIGASNRTEAVRMLREAGEI